MDEPKEKRSQSLRLGALLLIDETCYRLVTFEWLLDRGLATTPKYVSGHVDLC